MNSFWSSERLCSVARVPAAVLAWTCVWVFVFSGLALACTPSQQPEPPDTSERMSTMNPLTLSSPQHHLLGLAREPMLALHPSGALFLSGYPSQVTGQDPNSKPQLWISRDSGQSFEPVDVGASPDAAGNSDVDLAVSVDGTLYFAVMGFDRSTGQGTHISVGASDDLGETWAWNRVSETRLDDRPWVEVAPNGTAHLVWNDGEGVAHATSSDRGKSWQEQDRVHNQGGSSHFAIGPQGELAVRLTPMSASGNRFHKDVEHMAIKPSPDQPWVLRPVPGVREWPRTFADPTKVPRWVEPIAWDGNGTLFALWGEAAQDATGRMVLGRSKDQGATWQTTTVSEHPGFAFYPFLKARGNGDLAATWFVTANGDLSARVARLDASGAELADLKVSISEPFGIDAWNEPRGEQTERTPTPGGEYLPVAFLSADRLGIATPIQDAHNDRWGFSWWTAKP